MLSFTARPFYPGEINPGTHWIGGCVSLKAGLYAVVRRKIIPLLK
jgi:hypothetical protein